VVFNHSTHVRSIFLKFLDALQLDRPADLGMSIPRITAAVQHSTLDKVPRLAAGGVKIGVNINASLLSYNRRWPAKKYRTLIELLQRDRPRLSIFLVGGPGDVDYVRAFIDSCPNKEKLIPVAGRLDLLELTYALSRLDVLITNDSGPLHIAESVGTPVVAFFGPETPNLYGPLSANSLVFYRELFCSPCLNTYNQKRSRCTNNRCLRLIDAREVYEQMKARYPFLARAGESAPPPAC
jgi:ADP-heptose:LPS heptosyltransferase